MPTISSLVRCRVTACFEEMQRSRCILFVSWQSDTECRL